MEWYPVFYNGLETNVEVTKCGKVRRIKVDWVKVRKPIEINFTNQKSKYKILTLYIKNKKRKTVQVQQLVAAAFLNYKWNGHKNVVMHLDDNPLNNNLYNLKVDTQRENCSQARTIKSGLPVGVSFDKSRKLYLSQIRIENKKINLGRYKTIEDASNAYQTKLKSLN